MNRVKAILQAIIVVGAVLGGAGALGLSVRVFLYTSGLGG